MLRDVPFDLMARVFGQGRSIRLLPVRFCFVLPVIAVRGVGATGGPLLHIRSRVARFRPP